MDELGAAIADAQEALVDVARHESDIEWWDPQVLREKARNGHNGDVMMYALTDLVNREVFLLNRHLEVKLTPAP
jgi:hypothetical protein